VLYHARAVGQWVVVLLVACHMQQEQDAAWVWLKAQLTESLPLVLSSMSDGEINRNGWRKTGTDKAWDAGYQSLARCMNSTHKLPVPALSDADESIASERGSAAGESSDEELACTNLLEATLAVDPAVAPALQAFTATRKQCKDSRSKLKRGVKKYATSITGNRAVCKKTGKASINHYC
jgi:hypothetical protein